MARPVRIGIVGCGSVMAGPYMNLARPLQQQGLIEIVRACDVAPEKRQLVLDRFGISNFTADYRELVRAEDVDLVSVLTSMIEHGPIARAALEAGKHVMEIMLKAQAAGGDGRSREIESTFVLPSLDPVVDMEPAHLIHDRSTR